MIWFWLFASLIAQASPDKDPMRAALVQQHQATAAQLAAIRTQAHSIGAWRIPWSPAPPILDTPCEPLAESALGPLAEKAGKANDLDPKLVKAVIEQESGAHPCAISSAGAMGLMQLMPDTAQEMGAKDPLDSNQNVEAGAKYLKQLMDRYKGDLVQALGAYNAGPATVDRAGGLPDIFETVDYVDAILEKLENKGAPAKEHPPPRQ